MPTFDELKSDLDVALNEATLLGVEVDEDRRVAAAMFNVLTLPVEGPPSQDPRVQMVFRPVGRVLASLRNGRWDDPSAEVVPFQLHQLLEVVQSFGGLPIYGWEFFDVHADCLSQWANRLSVDWQSGRDGLSHSISMFQEGPERHLDLCLFFDDLAIRRPDGQSVPLEEFAAGGKRWWDGLYNGDKRTQGHGIIPAGPSGLDEA